MRRYSPVVAMRSFSDPTYTSLTIEIAYLIRNPHDLGWRVLVLEHTTLFKLPSIIVQSDDLNLVTSVLYEGAEREPEVLLRLVGKVDGV